MSDRSLVVPVIAGLAVGAALVFTFTVIFNSNGNAQQVISQRHGYVNISIQGLKTVYHVGENIAFTEQITGYDSDCNGYPDINIEAIDHSHTIFTTYDRNLDIGNCGDPDGYPPHMISLEYQSQKFFSSPIVADKAGKYILTATYAHGKVEKHFTVDNEIVPYIATVTIPEGASIYGSTHNNFEPETIKVIIGQNNTVRWVNYDDVVSSVVADDSNSGSAFYNATHNEDSAGMLTDNFLLPNKSFEFTFTKTGEYSYHSEPHPWMRGTVIVENEDSKMVDYTLHIGNMTFGIPYSLSGEKSQIVSIKPDFEHYGMSMVIARVDQNSTIDLHLPLTMLKEMEIASGYHYCVRNGLVLFIDNEIAEFSQKDTNTEEILTFPISAGNHTINISGTDLLYDPPRCD